MSVWHSMSRRWRMLAGTAAGAATGLLIAVACLRHGAGGGETEIGAAYLVAFFGWPISFPLSAIPWFGQIEHLPQFAFTALPLNYALIGAAAGALWQRRANSTQAAA